MYEVPQCCADAKGGGVYWMPSWYDGPKKDGWSINIQDGSYDPAWVNVTYCPFCGTKLKPKGE